MTHISLLTHGKIAKPKKAPVVITIRKSSRLRGEKPLAIEIDKENNIELLGEEAKVKYSLKSETTGPRAINSGGSPFFS